MGLHNPQDQGQGYININPQSTAGCGQEAGDPWLLEGRCHYPGLGGPCQTSELFLAGGKHLGV